MNQPVSQQHYVTPAGTTPPSVEARQIALRNSPPSDAGAHSTRRRGAPNRAALGRTKLATIAVSIAAFVGSLEVISQTSPQIKGLGPGSSQDALLAPQPSVQLPAPAQGLPQMDFIEPAPSSPSVSPLVLPVAPQRPTFRPFARTRGS